MSREGHDVEPHIAFVLNRTATGELSVMQPNVGSSEAPKKRRTVKELIEARRQQQASMSANCSLIATPSLVAIASSTANLPAQVGIVATNNGIFANTINATVTKSGLNLPNLTKTSVMCKDAGLPTIALNGKDDKPLKLVKNSSCQCNIACCNLCAVFIDEIESLKKKLREKQKECNRQRKIARDFKERWKILKLAMEVKQEPQDVQTTLTPESNMLTVKEEPQDVQAVLARDSNILLNNYNDDDDGYNENWPSDLSFCDNL